MNNRSICFLRTDNTKLVLALSFGHKLEKEYTFLSGSGKIVRHWIFTKVTTVDTRLIKEIIEKSIKYADLS